MDDLKSRVTPKNEQIVSALKENGEKLDYLCSLKERQYQKDSDQYMKWRKAKRNGGFLALIHLAIVFTTLYIGAVEVNTENSLVIEITTLANKVIGLFL